MKIVMNRNEFCKLDLHIRVINREINLSFCCNDYTKVPGIPMDLFKENPKKYLDEFFTPFHVHDRYTGHCFRNDDNMCNRLVDVYDPNMEVQIDVDTLTKCKASCYHCIRCSNHESGLSFKEEEELTKLILKTLDEYSFVDVIQMTSMGDASLYNLPDILQYYPKSISTFKILSNAFEPDNLRLAEEFAVKNNIPIEFWIPLPTLNKDIYASIYKANNFDRMMKWLTQEKHYKPIIIHYIAYEEGMNEIFDIVDFCKKYDFTLAIIPDFHSKISHKWVYELLNSGKLPRSEKVLYAIRS